MLIILQPLRVWKGIERRSCVFLMAVKPCCLCLVQKWAIAYSLATRFSKPATLCIMKAEGLLLGYLRFGCLQAQINSDNTLHKLNKSFLYNYHRSTI